MDPVDRTVGRPGCRRIPVAPRQLMECRRATRVPTRKSWPLGQDDLASRGPPRLRPPERGPRAERRGPETRALRGLGSSRCSPRPTTSRAHRCLCSQWRVGLRRSPRRTSESVHESTRPQDPRKVFLLPFQGTSVGLGSSPDPNGRAPPVLSSVESSTGLV